MAKSSEHASQAEIAVEDPTVCSHVAMPVQSTTSGRCVSLNDIPGMGMKVQPFDFDAYKPVHQVAFKSFPDAVRTFAALEPNAVSTAWLNKSCEVIQSFTRAQLWEYSGNIASMLVKEYCVKRGDRLMVVYPFGIDWVIAFLACLRIGAVVVSVYPPNPEKLAQDVPKFSHFVQDSGSTIALTVSVYKQLVTATSLFRSWPSKIRWIATDQCCKKGPLSKAAMSSPQPVLRDFDVHVHPDELAFVQYTSGSTGNPKGVMISHGNMFHQAMALDKGTHPAYPAGSARQMRYVGWAPQYHDMGLFAVLIPIFLGWDTTYTMSPLDWLQNPTMWPRALERYRGVMTMGPNFSFELTCKRLRERGETFDCSSVGVVVMGGEPTRLATMQETARTMRIPWPALHNTLGMAEHGVFVTAHGSLVREGTVSAGWLKFARFTDIDVRVVEEHEGELVEVEEGHAGEVCVHSPSVALGYWNKPELSAQVFQASIRGVPDKKFLRSGDLGVVARGELFLTSRLKDLIIVNGRNYAPSDLEAAAEAAFPALIRPGSSVAFQEQGLGGVVLVCELRRGQAAATAVESLVQRIRTAVEADCGLALHQVMLVAERALPKTTSGKVQRSKTAELVKAGGVEVCAATAAGKPNLDSCAEMADMLSALGVVDMERTLAENGVSSLELSQLVSVARRVLGLELDLAALAALSAGQLCSLQREGAGDGGAARREPRRVCPEVNAALPPVWLRLARQLAVVVLCVGAIAGATLPATAFVERCFEGGSGWWMSRGRGGPLVLVAVMLWMGSFSCICVVAKWVLVGARRPGSFCLLWSWGFTRWMLLERLLATWEFTVGRFLLDTPWLNLFYTAMGARVGWDARLSTFVRDCDMISIGRRASVKGKLYGRVFVKAGVHFGRVEVGADASVGGMSVVQPFSAIHSGVRVEPCTSVPPYSTLSDHGSRWFGNPCTQRPAASGKPEDAAASGGGEPFFATRAAFPLLFAALVAGATHLCNLAVPDGEWGAPFSRSLLWLTASYLVLFCASGLAVLLLTVALKWSFLSPWLTDSLASLVFGVFFPWLEKSFLVNHWHRAFGLAIGPRSSVIYSHFCSPSAAHLVSLGADCVAFNGCVVPRDPPTVWSWVQGLPGNPWSRAEKDIVIGDGVGLYIQSRVEAGSVLEDGACCAAFSRVGPGGRVKAGATAVGATGTTRLEGGGSQSAKTLRAPLSFSALHGLILLCHVAWLAVTAIVGLHLMLDIGGGDAGRSVKPWSAYARVPVRTLFGLAWVALMLYVEAVASKWLLVGRAREQQSYPFMSVRTVTMVQLFCCDHLVDGMLQALCLGTFLIDLYLRSLGFNIPVGAAFMNSTFIASPDADLVTIRPDAIVDQDAYVLAHQATLSGYATDRVFVDAGAVLHPHSCVLRGSIGAGASLLPLSKTLSTEHIPPGETWLGAPAYPVATVTEAASPPGPRGHDASAEVVLHCEPDSLSFRQPQDVDALPTGLARDFRHLEMPEAIVRV